MLSDDQDERLTPDSIICQWIILCRADILSHRVCVNKYISRENVCRYQWRAYRRLRYLDNYRFGIFPSDFTMRRAHSGANKRSSNDGLFARLSDE